jgi:Ca-activated chloride channel homolog
MKRLSIILAGTLSCLLFSCCGRHENDHKANYEIGPPVCDAAEAAAPPSQMKEEEYSHRSESGYHNTQAEPLSTFAIDVDAASYTNSRRMIMEGQLPPADAVRIEEFINYFHYNYPAPQGEAPFAIHTEYVSCPWNKEHGLLQVGLKGKEIELQEAPANNLVFLIDVSGSMNDDNKLPLLKKAFQLMIPKLRAKDKVSIVVYAGASGLILDGVDGDEKRSLTEALESLSAGGSTAGGAGIELAYKVAVEHFIKKGNNRVILATDGDFNVGVSSEESLQTLIEEKKQEGVYLSVLGFGEGNIKDNKMETLADKGNGNYYYIDNLLEARKVLVAEFGSTLITIAKDVKIQVEFNPAKVKEYRLIGYENRTLEAQDFNDDTKDGGELGAGHCVTALYEIIPADSKEQKTSIDALKYSQAGGSSTPDLCTIKFRYKGVKKKDDSSLLLQKTVAATDPSDQSLSVNIKLAAGVAEFAMLLRNSKEKGNASFDQAIELVRAASKNDNEGYVAGLISMIELSKDLETSYKKQEN